MPNRYIRESAIESEPVNALSCQGEVFYRRLLNRADDFGRFTANLALLRASLFPLQLDKVSEKDVARLLKEAEDCGLLATYGVDGKRFVTIAKWEKGRAQESKYPPPPEDICKRLQTYVYGRKHPSADVPDSDTDSDTDSDNSWVVAFGLELPLGLQTEECLKALKDWLAYKTEKRQGYKKSGLKAALTKWSNEFTSATFPSSVQNSMANNWQGVFPLPEPRPQRGQEAPPKPEDAKYLTHDGYDWRKSL
jgi:hypothetical protein